MILTKEQIAKMKEASKPLMKFLANPEIFHPHVKVIVESDRIELLEGVATERTDEFIVD